MRTLIEFWQWWTSGLLAVVPRSVKNQFVNRRNEVIVTSEQNSRYHIESTRNRKNGTKSHSVLIPDKPDLELIKRIKDRIKHGDILNLRLQKHECLVKRLNFPAIPRQQIQNRLAADMDQHTPFQSSDVYFNFSFANTSDGQSSDILLALAPRNVVNQILAPLSKLGISPNKVSVNHQEVQSLNLLNNDIGYSEFVINKTSLISTIIAIVLSVFAVYTKLDQQEKIVNELENRFETLTTIDARLDKKIIDTDTLGNRYDELVQRKLAQSSNLAILSEISQALSDHTWLTQVIIDKSTLTLEGETNSSVQILEQLERSSLLSNVSLTAAVSHNTTDTNERFKLTADIDTVQ